jgi:hypothetical protein
LGTRPCPRRAQNRVGDTDLPPVSSSAKLTGLGAPTGLREHSAWMRGKRGFLEEETIELSPRG